MKLKDNPTFHKHFSEKRFNPFIDPSIPSLTNIRKEGQGMKKNKPQSSQNIKPVLTLPEAHKYFRKYFREKKLNEFLDAELTYLSGSPKINLIKLDDYLHSKHGDYEKEELCLAEVLIKHYGEEAKRLIEKML